MTTPDSVLPASRQPMPSPSRQRQEPRTPAEMEQELNDTTDRLAARIDALVDRANPRRAARRGVAALRENITTADGRPKPEVVGAAVGALVGLALLVWRARRRR
ncbi:MAG: DUF3618 domain-containing protein [Jiangellaceae bacterium]|nr:DUF3618 domain-containing protein [Jiangellaceae bacterium]